MELSLAAEMVTIVLFVHKSTPILKEFSGILTPSLIYFAFAFPAHASCVFKGEIWVTGGRTAEYVMWNLVDSYKVADVWHSKNGGILVDR